VFRRCAPRRVRYSETMKILLIGLTLLMGVAAAQTTPAAPATTPTTQPAAQPSTTTPAQDPSTVVARVGSEDVTLAEFERQYRVYVARLVNNQGLPLTDDLLPYFNEYRGEILKQVARQRGILQLARNAGVSVDEQRVNQALASNKQQFPSDDAFKEALAQSGYGSEEYLRQLISESLLVSTYMNSLRDRFKFGDAVIAGYYNTHKADFTRDAQACVKHILVKDEAAAVTVKGRLDAGEDFAKVAQDVSLDPGSKEEGGDLGCFEQGVTVPEFDRAAFQGPMNALQQVKSQFGVHLLVVTKRTQGGLAPLAEVRSEIVRILANDAAQKYVESQLGRISTQLFADKVTLPSPEAK